MGFRTKALFPRHSSHIAEGARLAVINFFIYLIIGCLSFGLFKAIYWVRHLGLPVPLPVWLILLGTGIPCFRFWFHYGKTFGSLINGRRFVRGLSLVSLGNIPGLAFVYMLIKGNFLRANREISLIIFIMYIMLLLMMPIMVILGILDYRQSASP